MLKIRRPLGRLIFNMGIAIPGKTVFLIETAPWEREITEYVKSSPLFVSMVVLFTYGDFHVKDKTAVRTSYL